MIKNCFLAQVCSSLVLIHESLLGDWPACLVLLQRFSRRWTRKTFWLAVVQGRKKESGGDPEGTTVELLGMPHSIIQLVHWALVVSIAVVGSSCGPDTWIYLIGATLASWMFVFAFWSKGPLWWCNASFVDEDLESFAQRLRDTPPEIYFEVHYDTDFRTHPNRMEWTSHTLRQAFECQITDATPVLTLPDSSQNLTALFIEYEVIFANKAIKERFDADYDQFKCHQRSSFPFASNRFFRQWKAGRSFANPFLFGNRPWWLCLELGQLLCLLGLPMLYWMLVQHRVSTVHLTVTKVLN